MASVIPCLAWIPRGVAKRNPDKLKLDPAELQELLKNPGAQGSDDEESDDGERKRKLPLHKEPLFTTNEDITKKYDLDNYSDDEPAAEEEAAAEENGDDDEDWEDVDEASGEEEEEAGPSHRQKASQLDMAGLVSHGGGAQDPYLQEDGADTDDEDDKILEDDNLLLVGKVRGGMCTLEVHVYNHADRNLFCHHDSLLPDLPLCIEWVGHDPGDAQGNLVAVGTMEPHIELWDLDLQGALTPVYTLRGARPRGRKRPSGQGRQGHSGAVLGLAWNRALPHVLASGSEDHTVRLWDLETGAMATKLTHHSDKVQTVRWHAQEAELLLSGGFDGDVCVVDANSATVLKRWRTPGEVETACWSPTNPFHCYGATDTGHVLCWDARTDAPLWELQAHAAGVVGACPSPVLPALVTAGEDRCVRVWDLRRAGRPALVLSQTVSVQRLHGAALCPDQELTLAVSGDREFRVLELARRAEVRQAFLDTAADTEAAELDQQEVVLASNLTDEEEELEGDGEAERGRGERGQGEGARGQGEMGEGDGSHVNKEQKQGKKKKKPRHRDRARQGAQEKMDVQ